MLLMWFAVWIANTPHMFARGARGSIWIGYETKSHPIQRETSMQFGSVFGWLKKYQIQFYAVYFGSVGSVGSVLFGF
jgi:hypothetical protein